MLICHLKRVENIEGGKRLHRKGRELGLVAEKVSLVQHELRETVKEAPCPSSRRCL